MGNLAKGSPLIKKLIFFCFLLDTSRMPPRDAHGPQGGYGGGMPPRDAYDPHNGRGGFGNPHGRR